MDVLAENGKGNLSGISSKLILEYESEELADRILRAIDVDNYSYITCEREGKRIICVSKADEISTMLRTLDDFLSCAITAESVYRSI